MLDNPGALWNLIPNNTEHAVWALDDVHLENLDIKPGFLEESINECKVVAISDFAREFIHYATNLIWVSGISG